MDTHHPLGSPFSWRRCRPGATVAVTASLSTLIAAASGAAVTESNVSLEPCEPAPGFVTVADPGNACDPQATGCFGAVASPYRIATTEVTNAEYAAFLQAVAEDDTHGLYDPAMGTDPNGGITRTGAPESYAYAPIAGREDWPVTFVSFYDALRYANWLHNGRPSGAQDVCSTEDGAYTITSAGIASNSIVRNPGARFFLPSEDEWYKAAYYDPGTDTYLDYPAGSDVQTSCAAPGPGANLANCGFAAGGVSPVGAYPDAPSPNGTFDQGGNVFEWTEAIIATTERGLRGGAYTDTALALAAASRGFTAPSTGTSITGFRIAVVEAQPVCEVVVGPSPTSLGALVVDGGSLYEAPFMSAFFGKTAGAIQVRDAGSELRVAEPDPVTGLPAGLQVANVGDAKLVVENGGVVDFVSGLAGPRIDSSGNFGIFAGSTSEIQVSNAGSRLTVDTMGAGGFNADYLRNEDGFCVTPQGQLILDAMGEPIGAADGIPTQEEMDNCVLDGDPLAHTTATLKVEDHAVLDTGAGFLGGAPFGDASVAGMQSGTATLDLTRQARWNLVPPTCGGDPFFRLGAGERGTGEVSAEDSTISATGTPVILEVGSGGTGVLKLASGASAIGSSAQLHQLHIGVQSGGEGTVTVDSLSSLALSGPDAVLTMGWLGAGEGTLTANGPVTVDVTEQVDSLFHGVQIAAASGSTGTLSLDGDDASLTLTGPAPGLAVRGGTDLIIGGMGLGKLFARNGADISVASQGTSGVQGTVVGERPGSEGHLELTDDGTTLTPGPLLLVGHDFGFDVATVPDPPSVGHLLVADSAAVQGAFAVAVGNGGEGHAVVSGGGTIDAAIFGVGTQAGVCTSDGEIVGALETCQFDADCSTAGETCSVSLGTVTVTGAGSVISSGDVWIGENGGADTALAEVYVTTGGRIVAPTVEIGAAGRLGGDSEVAGTVAADEGVIGPGSATVGSTGTLTLQGLSLEGATLEIDVAGASPGEFDRIEVTDPATLSSGQLRFLLAPAVDVSSPFSVGFLGTGGTLSEVPAGLEVLATRGGELIEAELSLDGTTGLQVTFLPEPGGVSGLVLGSGVLALLAASRRRSAAGSRG